MKKNEIFENRGVLKDATPVARKVAVNKMQNGMTFQEIESEFNEIKKIEQKMYANLKESMTGHIRRHGLDKDTMELFDEFVRIKEFSFNDYEKVLGHINKVCGSTTRELHNLYLTPSGTKNEGRRELEIRLTNLEYLTSKVREFLKFAKDLGNTAYDLIMSGKEAVFLEKWGQEALCKEAVDEENKQFLKQSLHHLEVLEKNHAEVGLSDLRMLLYHRKGACQDNLYRKAEKWIVKIYYNLTKREKDCVYDEICSYVDEVAPQVNYISPMMIRIIIGEDSVSDQAVELLVKYAQIIKSLGMGGIVLMSLKDIKSEVLKKNDKTKARTLENIRLIMVAY